MVISGWDYYVIRVQDGQAEAIYWKDENAVDPNGDPMFDEYAGMFSRRVFRDDQTATPTEYRPNDELPAIEENEIKHGRWITEEFAKQIRVL